MNVRLLEPAEQERDEAVAYYNAQVGGLGDAFLVEALRVLGSKPGHPSTFILHPCSVP